MTQNATEADAVRAAVEAMTAYSNAAWDLWFEREENTQRYANLKERTALRMRELLAALTHEKMPEDVGALGDQLERHLRASGEEYVAARSRDGHELGAGAAREAHFAALRAFTMLKAVLDASAPNFSWSRPKAWCGRTVRLYEQDSAFLIVPAATGIKYTIQVGGTGCFHPEIEGYVVPLQLGASLNRELAGLALYDVSHDICSSPEGFPEEDAKFIERKLATALTGEIHERYRVEVLRKNPPDAELHSCEAWVNVLIHLKEDAGEEAHLPFTGPFPLRAVLTWCNSD